MAIADQLRDQAVEADHLGRRPDITAKLLKSARIIAVLGETNQLAPGLVQQPTAGGDVR